MRHCEPIWGADTATIVRCHRGYHEAWVQSEMKLSTNEWLGRCSKHFPNKYCLLIRIHFVR